MSEPRGYSNTADAIAIAIGNTPLWWEQSGYPSPSPHWQHGWDEACAICKAGYAPWALRVLIDRILSEHAALSPPPPCGWGLGHIGPPCGLCAACRSSHDPSASGRQPRG